MASTEAKIAEIANSGLIRDPLSRRAFLTVAGAAGVSLIAAGCGSGSSGGSTTAAAGGATTGASAAVKRGTIVEQVTTLSNDYFVGFDRGAHQFAQALGLDLKVFEDQGNANQDLAEIGNIKTSGGQMMFGISATAAIVPAVVRAASAAGIYYSNAYDLPAWYTPLDGGDYFVLMQTPPSVGVAKETATRLFREMGGEGTVIHVPGGPGSTADDQRTAGFRAALKDFPGITVVTTAPGNWVAQDAGKAFANKLPSVKDFKGVFAQNDSEAQGVIAALDARGIKGKLVTGFDGNRQNIEYVAKGKQFLTSATVGGLQAALSGIAVFDALNGWKPTVPERMLYTQAPIIAKDNAQQFLDTIYVDPLPFDWELMSRTLHPNDWDPQQGLTPIDPNEFFAGQPGKDKLNAGYADARSSGAFDQARKQLADHWKSGPFKQFASASVFTS